MKRVFPFLLVLTLSCQSSPKVEERVEIGSAIGRVGFTDIRYLRRTLDDFGAKKATVLVFVLQFWCLSDPLVYRWRMTQPRMDNRSSGLEQRID